MINVYIDNDGCQVDLFSMKDFFVYFKNFPSTL